LNDFRFDNKILFGICPSLVATCTAQSTNRLSDQCVCVRVLLSLITVLYVYTVSHKKTSPMFLAITRESIVRFS